MSNHKDNHIANGFIALLEEPQSELKKYALEQLDKIVPEYWAEISYAIQKMYTQQYKSNQNISQTNQIKKHLPLQKSTPKYFYKIILNIHQH